MNKVIIIGNLTKDPELAETSSGIAYTNLSVAVSRPFVNEDGERATDFFNVTVWRTQAENCAKYLTKGKKVSIIARLQNRTYEDIDVRSLRTATIIIPSGGLLRGPFCWRGARE